jgi:folate-binding protein YgfZ
VLHTASGISLDDGSAAGSELAGVNAEVVCFDWPGLPRIDVVCDLEAGDHAFHTARVMRGVPSPGNELSDRVNPLEAGLGRFISFTKGCYIGQEVIARLDSYDKLQRRLVRLAAYGDLRPGDTLTVKGKKAGEVTSVAALSTTRERIALGFVRRGSWEPGTELECGDVKVTVKELS